MLAGRVQGLAGVLLQDQPREALASHRMDIKCKPAGNESRVYGRYRGNVWERKGKDHESCLYSGSGSFIEEGGLAYVSPQASRNWLEQR